MKKLISGLAAIAILAMPVTAFADTIIQPKGGNPFDISPDPETANTTVSFSVNPTYTVTIPATVDLTAETDGTYSGRGTISAANVKLEEGKKIVVKLTSASKFNMKTSATSLYDLPYTAQGEGLTAITDKVNGGKVAEFTNPASATSTTPEPQTAEVTFTTDEVPKYAGTYTDPVVFTLSIE